MRTVVAAALISLGLASCQTEEPHTLSWALGFDDPALRARAVVLEARILEGGCASDVVVYLADLEAGSMAASPPRLLPGTFGLAGRARDAECRWFAAECVEVTLPGESNQHHRLALAEIPEEEACPVDACDEGRCVTMDAGTPPRDAIADTMRVDLGRPDAVTDARVDVGTCDGVTCDPGLSRLAAGGSHSCAVAGDGSVWCWGINRYGEIGDGTLEPRPTPVEVAGAAGAVGLSLGGWHACALLDGGRTRCWGRNASGQLGDGSTVDSTRPVDVAGVGDARALSSGSFHTCVIRSDDSLWCWGLNNHGQLGVGDTDARLVPVRVPSISDVVQFAGNYQSSCALERGGVVYCWGQNPHGQVGDGTEDNDRLVPTRVDGLDPAVMVGSGIAHSCALHGDGTVSCWGEGTFGALGTGDTTDALRPVDVLGLADAEALRVGGYFNCAARRSGEVVCWGHNSEGMLGEGTTSSRFAPGPAVVGIGAVRGLSDTLHAHTCAQDATGQVLCWGRNEEGQIGDGTSMNDRPVPVPVMGLP